MNRADYMAALRRALSVLPEEERANALRYYEEYFDDAGPENEAKAIEELGEPAKVAAQILADYRELTAVPHAQPIKEKRRWRGISPLLLIVLVLLAIPIGLPLVFGAGAGICNIAITTKRAAPTPIATTSLIENNDFCFILISPINFPFF